MRETFDIDLPVRSIFEKPTIREYALLIEERLLEEIEQLTPEEAARQF